MFSFCCCHQCISYFDSFPGISYFCPFSLVFYSHSICIFFPFFFIPIECQVLILMITEINLSSSIFQKILSQPNRELNINNKSLNKTTEKLNWINILLAIRLRQSTKIYLKFDENNRMILLFIFVFYSFS